MNEQFTVTAVDAKEGLRDPTIRAAWDALSRSTHNENMMCASPNWVGHLDVTSENPVRLWCVRDAAGTIIGVVPAHMGNYDLQFTVLNRLLFHRNMNVAHILGCVPILPECSEIIKRVIGSIFADWPQCNCIVFDELPTETYFWKFLCNEDLRDIGAYSHVVSGSRPRHLLDLGPSFDAYLKTLSSKSRSSLRRHARQAGNTSRGPAKIRRVTAAREVKEFLQDAVEVSRRTWQHKILGERIRCDENSVRTFEDLASRGILRAYILSMGATPSAFVIGYQQSGVFLYSEIGYRDDLVASSPGTGLLYFIIEDLHKFNPPKTLNFGMGDASYKRRYGNRETSDASCLILRRGVANSLWTTAHTLWSSSRNVVKQAIGRMVNK